MNEHRQLTIAGEACLGRYEPALRRTAERVRTDKKMAPLPESLNARSLSQAETGAAYAERYLTLVRRKGHIDTLDFDVPHRNSVAGRLLGRVRTFVWKCLRYQHDRMAFRQNLVNSHLVSLIEVQNEELTSEIAALKQRLAEVEAKVPADQADPGAMPS